MSQEHISVMLNEAIQSLDIKDDGVYVDLTLGRAGHSSEILKKLKTGTLIAFDKDKTAIEKSGNILSSISKNFKLIHSDFKNIKIELDKLGIKKVDGILADLGVSSPQLDNAHRGFSFKKEADLDMRMNQDQTLKADEIVNSWSEEDLVNIFRNYADVKPAWRVAKGIISKRPIYSTTELSRVINDSLPHALTRKKNFPKVIFQAIRIAVNDEIKSLELMVDNAISLLNVNGTLSIITFHSIEDRIVRNIFKKYIEDNTGKLPVIVVKQYKAKTLKPSKSEIDLNRRSRSAKLRTLKKLI